MATEQLYEVVVSGRYDLVVLDTPPVKNALDFLESPGRLVQFLDKRILSWFLAPYEEKRVVGRLFRGTSAMVFKLLGYIFGQFLDELAGILVHLSRSLRRLPRAPRGRHRAVLDARDDLHRGLCTQRAIRGGGAVLPRRAWRSETCPAPAFS